MRPYQLSIPTNVSKGGKRVVATVDKACGSGSGGNCIDITCRVCISFTLDFTFGGALAGIGVITITGVDTGSQYLWEDPPASSPTATIPTSCGGLRIFFQISYDGTATLQIRLNGVLIVSRSSSMRVCEPFVPGDPTEFIYPQPLVDGSEEEGYGPDFTVSGNEDGCNGAASIVVTNSGSGDGSGSTNPYDFALDTLLTKGGKRVLAAINCAGSGSGNSLYWYGYDTGLRKNGKRVLAGYNPCCGSGPNITYPRLPWGGCSEPPDCETMPSRLYLTLSWNNNPFTASGPPQTRTILLTYLPSLSLPSYGTFGFIGNASEECSSTLWVKISLFCENGLGYSQWRLCFSNTEPSLDTAIFYDCEFDATYCGFGGATVINCNPHYAVGAVFLSCSGCRDAFNYVQLYISETPP